MDRLAFMDRPTGRPIRRYEHDRPGDLVTWTSRSSAASLQVAAIACTAGLPGRSTVAPTDRPVATTTCTPRSTTTPGWPRSRSWVTSGPSAALGAGAAPTTGSPCTASPSSACLPTTGSATAAGCSGRAGRHRRAPSADQTVSAPEEREGGAVQPDPARGVGYQRLYWSNAARTVPCSPGSIGTTITAPTPPSAAGHPSAASTTSPAITPRTRRAGRCPGAGRPGRSGGPRTGPGPGRTRPNGRLSRPREW